MDGINDMGFALQERAIISKPKVDRSYPFSGHEVQPVYKPEGGSNQDARRGYTPGKDLVSLASDASVQTAKQGTTNYSNSQFTTTTIYDSSAKPQQIGGRTNNYSWEG